MSQPDITRRQAWMKLAVLIADGLPEPKSIRFNPSGGSINIGLDDDTTVAAWARKFGIETPDEPIASTEGDYWIHGASTFGWHGWYVRFDATTPVSSPEVPAEDLAKVREIAGGDDVTA